MFLVPLIKKGKKSHGWTSVVNHRRMFSSYSYSYLKKKKKKKEKENKKVFLWHMCSRVSPRGHFYDAQLALMILISATRYCGNEQIRPSLLKKNIGEGRVGFDFLPQWLKCCLHNFLCKVEIFENTSGLSQENILGMFVLKWMHFSCLIQIWM